MKDKTIYLSDITVYLVMSNEFRAYVNRTCDGWGCNAWGGTKQKAIDNLAVVLANKGYSFNFGKVCTICGELC